MILRRITQHVKDQNWFAVFLDFFIVVAGILIAFQITNWNEARQDKRLEDLLISRLVEEFTALELVLIQRIDRAEDLVASTSDLIALIRKGDKPGDEASPKELLHKALRFNAPVPPPNAFSEALQSGRIGSIRNQALRRVLYEYEITIGWWKAVLGGAVPQTDVDSNLRQAITLSAERNPEDFGRGRVLSFDWATVRLAEKELVIIYEKQSLQAEVYRLELKAVREVLLELEKT